MRVRVRVRAKLRVNPVMVSCLHRGKDKARRHDKDKTRRDKGKTGPSPKKRQANHKPFFFLLSLCLHIIGYTLFYFYPIIHKHNTRTINTRQINHKKRHASQVKKRPDQTRHDTTRHDTTRQDKERPRLDRTRHPRPREYPRLLPALHR